MKKYENQIPTNMRMGLTKIFSILRDTLLGRAKLKPAANVDVETFRLADEITVPDAARVTWFGHSAFLLEIESKRLLFDPMLGTRIPWAGAKRYSKNLPLQPEDFPAIDAIILSHDHYDHLDYSSIRKLNDKTRQFIVPLGVGRHLIKWGVAPEKISEHQWYEELVIDGLTLACMPARHFSGRGLFNRNSTLWCSWVIVGRETRVYFSGDSGYGPHFKEIGETYGPFDLTMMECGQYDERWLIHMKPEETVQAHLDLRGQLLIPIHWGAFTLAFHLWTDPIERVTKAASAQKVIIATPKIGETVVIASKEIPTSTWWKK
ncbi:MBL fold metallo-hydrolase [Paenibacillus radicis (ex Xue et al. 2023)]|uniref:MBL fold metallo-hydrolase n=1 Tax=Paenibacillus radicis (ex Xue et al. 2023) TaxID=2972489 RepID=A0ABT1YFV0_9BACL|nr:MBL fold metallo-hydrolase [Paenibacillus radicis (ex Xue et al. 2023)]MCR8632079.1 MBL fold metallo-hydrolase [Paenibacillus radicis (ex Xue et al. 2023)]